MSGGRGKFLPAILSTAGVVLVVLGLDGRFTFVSCGAGFPTTCIYVYTLDVVAILAGTIVTYKGLQMYRRASD